MTQQQNGLGYGVRLVNPEGFIRAAIKHFFSPVSKDVDWENILHEARVALFEEDLKQGNNISETTGGYWWRVARAVGILLREDYNIQNGWCFRSCRPFGAYYNPARTDQAQLEEVYLQRQRDEETPDDEVAVKDWFDHYSALAEGVLLDSEDVEQGDRDLQIFELWVNGYSPKEIAERLEVSSPDAVDGALRRIIKKLRDFFGTDSDDIMLGSQSNTASTSPGQKKRFAQWYADPENRERHRKRCRERKREQRAKQKKVE